MYGNNNEKIIFIINSLEYLLNHRYGLLKSLSNKGFKIDVYSDLSNTYNNNLPENVVLKKIFIKKNNNKFFLLITLINIFFIILLNYRNKIHLLTIQPILFGLISSFILRKKKVFISISGLGSIYSNKIFYYEKIIYSFLLKKILSKQKCHFFFQHNGDLRFFKKYFFSNQNLQTYTVLNGAGVNLNRFEFTKINNTRNILFASRLLKEKGLEILIDACKLLSNKNVNFTCTVIGQYLNDNRHIPLRIFNQIKYKNKFQCNYLGNVSDVIPYIQKADIVVLPTTYNEGIPRILIESCSVGRPIITTKQFGCKIAVKHEYNGIILKKVKAEELSTAILRILNNYELKSKFSKNSRKIAENLFDENIIINKQINKLTEC